MSCSGAIISLDALGPQDEYLISKDESFFKPNQKQHSNFAMYQKEYKLQGPFIGAETKYILNPRAMGDLMSNMWIKCTLPELGNPVTNVQKQITKEITATGETTVIIEPQAGYEISNVYISNSFNSGGVANVDASWLSTYSDITVDIDASGVYSNVSWVATANTQTNTMYTTGSNATIDIYDGDFTLANTIDSGGTATKVTFIFTYDLVQPKYCDQVGRALLKNVKFRVGANDLQTLRDDWYIVRDQLFNTYEQKEGLKYMINGGQDLGQLPKVEKGKGPIDLFIPLELFFCHRENYTADTKNRHPYFPLCACYNQEIELSIEFNKLTYFSGITGAYEAAGETMPSYELSNVQLVVEMIDLEQREKQFYSHGSYEIIAPTVFPQPTQEVSVGDTTSIEFIPNGNIRMSVWFLRCLLFENDNNDEYFNNRYNFSSINSENITTQDTYNVLKEATLYLEGFQKQNFDISHLYYKLIQPIDHNCFPPELNIYMISHALLPLSSQPSGSLNLSTNKANLKLISEFKAGSSPGLTSSPFVMNMFHYGEMVLKVENGQLTPIFSLV